MGLIENNLLPVMWVVLSLSTFVFAWALLWDRARGRLRCRRCRYRMEGSPPAADGSITCPECGRMHRHERRLRFTRRRWKTATLALLVVLTSWYAIDYHWRFRERGWWGYVPTTVLIALPRNSETWHEEGAFLVDASRRTPKPMRTRLYDEMRYRTLDVGLWVWQEELHAAVLMRYAAPGDADAREWHRLQVPDVVRREWEVHRCDRCGGWADGPGNRMRCPGDGAVRVIVEPWSTHILEKAKNIGEIITNQRVIYPFRMTSDEPLQTVFIEEHHLSGAEHSNSAWYYSDDAGVELIEAGMQVLRMEVGWSPVSGRTPATDLSATWDDHACVIRRFDLSPTFERAAVGADERPNDWDDRDLTGWIMDECIADLDGSNGDEPVYPVFVEMLGRHLFIASTPEGLEEIAVRFQAFHEATYRKFWRDFPDD